MSLKYHNEHIVKCPRCLCFVLRFLYHRVVANKQEKMYRCAHCYHQFRCCSNKSPVALTKRIKSLRIKLKELTELDKKRRMKTEKTIIYKLIK